MAMTPQELERMNKLEKLVASLVRVENIEFIKNAERKLETGIDDISTTTTVTTISRSVNESGASSYSVAKQPDRKVGIQMTDGSFGFIGVYNS